MAEGFPLLLSPSSRSICRCTKILVLHIKILTMECRNDKGIRYVYSIIKKLGVATFWGTRCFETGYCTCSEAPLFSGFSRSHELLMLLLGGRYNWNFTVFVSKGNISLGHRSKYFDS